MAMQRKLVGAKLTLVASPPHMCRPASRKGTCTAPRSQLERRQVWTMAPGPPSLPLSVRPCPQANVARANRPSVRPRPSGLRVRCSFTLLNYATDGCLPFFFGSRLDAAAAAWHERRARPSADTRGRFRRMLLRFLLPSLLPLLARPLSRSLISSSPQSK